MASYLPPSIVNQIIDTILRGGYLSLPAPLYLSLLVAPPYDDGYGTTYFDAIHEVTYTGYARRTLQGTLTGWLGTHGGTGESTGTSGTIRPAASQFFPLCTTSSQLVTHAVLTDSSTRGNDYNTVYAVWELPRPMQLSASAPGFYPCMHAESLTLRIDT